MSRREIIIILIIIDLYMYMLHDSCNAITFRLDIILRKYDYLFIE